MSKRLVLKSGISSDSEDTSQMLLIFWLQMLLLKVDLTIEISYSGASLLLTFISCSVSRTVLLESSSMLLTHITHVTKTIRWLPFEDCSVFKIVLLVYKFLRSGYPKYFEPLLKPRHSVQHTHRSQTNGVVLEVLHFALISKLVD